MALSADALVHTLKGDKHVAKLAHRDQSFYGFTWDGKRIAVGRVKFALATRRAVVQRLVLDDGTSVHMTEDQAVVHRTGASGSPNEVGLSLMPLYLGKTSHGYPTYKQMHEGFKGAQAPCDRRRVRLVARMAYEWVSKKPIETGMIVRHKNGNKKDCEPDNLRLEGKPNPKRMRAITKLDPRRHPKLINNHKVVGFEDLGEDDVHDIIEADCENIAIGGIFVVTHGAS